MAFLCSRCGTKMKCIETRGRQEGYVARTYKCPCGLRVATRETAVSAWEGPSDGGAPASSEAGS